MRGATDWSSNCRSLSACNPVRDPLWCDTVETFQAGCFPHMAAILGDIKNYTDLAPTVQISEIVVA